MPYMPPVVGAGPRFLDKLNSEQVFIINND